MEAIFGVWLTSLVGASAFSVAGYVLGQRGVIVPGIHLPEEKRPGATPATPAPPPVIATTEPTPAVPPVSTPPASARDRATPDLPTPEVGWDPVSRSDRFDDNEAPTVQKGLGLLREEITTPVPRDVQASVETLPPPPNAPHLARSSGPPAPGGTDRDLRLAMADLETTRADLRAAIARAESAAQRARASEVVKTELEKQLETLRTELRQEVVARAAAEKRAEELGDRLASASEEAGSLRHRVSTLDKQSKQLREALQGRVRQLTASEQIRKRDLEETDEIRLKLRDVYEKLERSSLPPGAGSNPPGSFPPGTPSSPGMSAVRSVRPEEDAGALKQEIARLTAENRELRTRALGGSIAPKPIPRGSVPDLDLETYRNVIDRVGGVAGLRGAVIADEVGSLLVGSGELAEGLAAFGAYIRDASARTDRLLPLEGVEEVDIRDRGGMLLCTRVIAHAPEVSLVLLGAAQASILAAKKIAEDGLRLR